jgi:thioredoxin-like negative regulator of GroEL
MKGFIVVFFMIFLTGSVLVVNDKNIGKVLEENQNVFLLFCIPANRHCKKLEVELIKTEDRVGSQVLFGKVDQSFSAESSEIYKLTKNPSFYLFHKGKLLETYEGSFYTQEMSAWIFGKIRSKDL